MWDGVFGVFVVVGCGKILIKSPLERKESLDRVFVTVLNTGGGCGAACGRNYTGVS